MRVGIPTLLGAALVVAAVSPTVWATGGTIVLRTDNSTGYYYGLGGSGETLTR